MGSVECLTVGHDDIDSIRTKSSGSRHIQADIKQVHRDCAVHYRQGDFFEI